MENISADVATTYYLGTQTAVFSLPSSSCEQNLCHVGDVSSVDEVLDLWGVIC